MKYALKQKHYNDFKVFEIDKLAPRGYAIPYRDLARLKSVDITDERYESDLVTVLSGKWGFKYYKDVADLPDVFDTETEKLDVIDVPSTWQRTGYEHPNYLNSRYQFPLKPPIIPKKQPMAVYVKTFDLEKNGGVYLLNFLGVCSCFDLYVNGKFAGYSEGSHNTAEFDITQYITVGKNEIVAAVYKWCNGSYLECQDMFRENGIFRDVFIIAHDHAFLWDFSYETAYRQNTDYDFTFGYKAEKFVKGDKVAFTLFDEKGNEICSDSFDCAKGKKTYALTNLSEWSAEIPTLYMLIASCTSCGVTTYYRQYAGFKHIEIKGSVFYLNNQKIKLKGVNQHESNPKTGFAVTAKFLENDIKLMKAYNMNAVRLSHYPHDPVFLALCDKYGLYAVDEMDLEAHGIYSNPLTADYSRISDNMAWKERFLDRAKRMFYRDRCRACVVMWSLGNESGGYKCHNEAAAFFKSVSDIPVHYEGVRVTKQFCYDIVAQFYPSMSDLQSYEDKTCKDKRNLEKPYFMSEYAHAMGVGPGGMSGYMDFILRNDNFVGGCIWEFCDHVVENPNAAHLYTYGGDYNEKKHDGNFCVDGLFFPDRSPSTGALNVREVYRPVRGKKIDGGIELFNTNYFLSAADYKIAWKLLKDGEAVDGGDIKADIAPQMKRAFALSYDTSGDADYILDVSYNTASGGYIAREQFVLKRKKPVEHEYAKPKYAVNNKILTAEISGGTLKYSLKSGEFISYKIGGKELVNQKPLQKKRGFLPNIYRVPIDNDRFIKILWNSLGLLKAKPVFRSAKITDGDELTVEAKYSVRGKGKLATATVSFVVSADGAIDVSAKLKKSPKLTFYNDIPRFGLTFEMPKRFDKVRYYGLGDRETLSDFCEHGFTGVYEKSVKDMHEHYVMPQESGNRSRVWWAEVTDDDGDGIRIDYVDNPFNFNANHFTRYELAKCRHSDELKEYDTTNVQIDGFMRGAGSQSCGHQPTPPHIVNLKVPIAYKFRITPICKK